jgi:hypothetical protein
MQFSAREGNEALGNAGGSKMESVVLRIFASASKEDSGMKKLLTPYPGVFSYAAI